MSKHSGEETLLQIFENIKNQVDSLKKSIESKQKPFVVTATADFQNGVYTNVSHTYDEIIEACERGDHVFIVGDISQMFTGQHCIAPVTSYGNGSINIDYISSVNAKPYFVTATIRSDNTNRFSMTELAPQTQLSHLTFKTSSSVPTVDDRSVITFVIEG